MWCRWFKRSKLSQPLGKHCFSRVFKMWLYGECGGKKSMKQMKFCMCKLPTTSYEKESDDVPIID